MLYTKNNPLRVVTLCSGYDSQCMALDRLKEYNPEFDYELIGWSEIDHYAIKAHNAVYPQWSKKNLGDMTKIDWSLVPDFDFLTYSTPCFPAGTLVNSDNGFTPIEELKVGDYVLTHMGKYEEVGKIYKKQYRGNIYTIKAMCFDEIRCTENHPFYVRKKLRKWNNPIRRWSRQFGEPFWCEAKGLNKDMYLGYAVGERSSEELYPNWKGCSYFYGGRESHSNIIREIIAGGNSIPFMYIIGRYLGDGWLREDDEHNSLIICCGKNEDTTKLEDAFEACKFNVIKTEERTTYRFTVNNKELCQFCHRFGKYSYGKKIDHETTLLPIGEIKSLIQGYIDSDGSYTQNNYKITSVSKELIYGVGFLIAKVYKCPFRIYKSERKHLNKIEGRTIKQRTQYQIVWHPEVRKQDHAFYEDGIIWFPINQIDHSLSMLDVYNLEVASDHTYTANGCIVHNCTDFSNAGKQAGGEEGSGTRSSILWFTREAIKVKRPKYLFMENVKALVSDKFKPLFRKWEQELAGYGYQNFCKVLNAKDYGVPQNRERIFMISILSEEDAHFSFPEPFELKTRLADVLEEDVEEKYYLDDEKVQSFIAHCDRKQAEGCGFKFEPSAPPTYE